MDAFILSVDLFDEAAVLAASGFHLHEVSLQPSGRVRFDFQDEDGSVSRTLLNHRSGSHSVNSLMLTRKLREVKSALFRARREGGMY